MSEFIAFVLGAVIGYFLGKRAVQTQSQKAHNLAESAPAQAEIKEDNIGRILNLAREKGEIANNDVEFLLDVSDATAERYLAELENRGELIQVGKTGRSVTYRPRS